jgi:hypothetical protein
MRGGVEKGEEGCSPARQRASESCNRGDRAGREGSKHTFGDLASLGRVAVTVGGAEFLGARSGEVDRHCSSVRAAIALSCLAHCLSVSFFAPARRSLWMP